MVQVSYPGVYILEKSSGVKTITGVATSIAAFFGRAAKGPIDAPVRCLGYPDFLRNFGGAHPNSELASSVKQFFDNGGTDCYVVRLAGAGAMAAGIHLQNWATTDVLTVTAKMAGVWGNGLRLQVDYNTPDPGETFNLRVSQDEGGVEVASEVHSNLSMDSASPRFAPLFVTQSSSLINLDLFAGVDFTVGDFDGFAEARRPLGTSLAEIQATLAPLIGFGNPSGSRRFEISVNGSAFVPVNLADLDVNDAAITTTLELADAISDVLLTPLAALVPAQTVNVTLTTPPPGGQFYLRFTAASAGAQDSVKIRRAPSEDISAALMFGVDNGGVELARLSNFRPAATGSVLRIEGGGDSLANLNDFAEQQQDDLTGITIGSEPLIPLNADPNNILTTALPTDPFFADAQGALGAVHGNNDGVREKLNIIAQAISNAPGSRYRAEVHGYQLVILAKEGTFNEIPASIAFAGPNSGNVNPRIARNTRQYKVGADGTNTFASIDAAPDQRGNDGAAPAFVNYVGNPIDKTGFHALDTTDLFNMMILPADSELTDVERQQLWGPASIYCHSRRAILIIDAPDSWTDSSTRPAIVQNSGDVNNLRATVVKDHSAVFYPKVLYNDRGVVKAVGAGGAIAGLLARTDATRGVWKAAAGTDADLRGVSGLHVKLTDLENGVLNKLGVNCMRGFPSGYVNWGARTLDGSDDIGSEYKYLPIRRLALNIEESLFRGTKWVVFEPNDEPLYAKIRLNINVFMNQLFRQGAFQGSTPDTAYYVKCDGETTTEADRNLGIVNIEVGFAPLKPAEFVVITLQQMAGDLG